MLFSVNSLAKKAFGCFCAINHKTQFVSHMLAELRLLCGNLSKFFNKTSSQFLRQYFQLTCTVRCHNLRLSSLPYTNCANSLRTCNRPRSTKFVPRRATESTNLANFCGFIEAIDIWAICDQLCMLLWNFRACNFWKIMYGMFI